ncbi:tail fiber domain-containing protein [Nannocystis pusilla]|uniref:tail fiber domain-containing protein n=1 Tax=Nannocystis pusilla TaxID=889268 RepID=UPI003B7BF248
MTDGSDTGTQGASTSSGAAATSSEVTTDSTSATATSTATTGPTSGDASSTGGACSKQSEPCDAGQQCCDGLTCCAGVPVPRGEEFCSDNCPISDRNAKTDLRPVDAGEVLSRVVALDITTWRYKHDGAEVRHLGPMAQDFKAAFGLWNTDRMIFPLDAAGVSLAAIQGLHRRLVAAEAENDELRARLDRLERRLAALSPAQP